MHIVGVHERLYFSFWWYDIFAHFLGGMCVCFGILYGVERGWCGTVRIPRVMFCILGTLAVGVVWEVYEIAIGISYTEPDFVIDTTYDLMLDTIGGIVAYYSFIRFTLHTRL